MCVYSAYVREVKDQMPWITPMPGISTPWVNPIAQPAMDPAILKEILDIGKRLDRIDKALGLKDCREDVAKRAFEANLEKLIKQAQDLKLYGKPQSVSIGSLSASSVSAPVFNGTITSCQSGSAAGFSLGDREA